LWGPQAGGKSRKERVAEINMTSGIGKSKKTKGKSGNQTRGFKVREFKNILKGPKKI